MLAMVLFVAALLLLMGAGFLLVLLLWPSAWTEGGPGLVIPLSWACGAGVLSLVYAFARIGNLGSPWVIAGLDLLAVAFLVAYGGSGCEAGQQPPAPAAIPQPARRSALYKGLLAALGVLAITFVVRVVYGSYLNPHGDWDAWAIWNLNAKFLYLGGDNWRDVFVVSFHSDYPLLLPGTVARLWTYTSTTSALVPMIVASIFGICLVCLTISALTLLRGRSQGALAGVILLGTPLVVHYSYAQYADVPLAFYFLASMATYMLARRSAARGLMLLSGFLAGWRRLHQE